MASLLEVYKKALASMKYVENDVGHIVTNILNEAGDGYTQYPVLVQDRPLVLPHKHNLVADRLEEVIAFHPLSESVIRGESEVLVQFRKMLLTRFKLVFSELALWMVEKAIDPKAARQFSPKQKAFFDILADATPNTFETLNKIFMAGYSGNADYRLANIYLRRTGATFEGNKVTRAAIVSFPFMEAKGMDGKKHTWCGSTVTQKDMRMLTALANYLVPSIEEPGELYNYGSNDTQAPYFDALIHSFAKLMENMNNILLLLGDKFERKEYLYTDLSWVQDFEPLSQYRGQILSLPFNDGVPLNNTPEPTKVEARVVQPEVTKVTNSGISGASADPVGQLLNKLKNPAPAQPTVWGQTAASEEAAASLPDDSYNRLMVAMYKKNGLPIPSGGFGTVDVAFGAPQEPQSPSALRRRQAKAASEVRQLWSGARRSSF